MISNDRRQRKIKNVLGVLREGTVDVRRNPTAENYKHWEAKIARAGRDRSVVWVVVILGVGVLFIGVKIVSHISSTPPKIKRVLQLAIYTTTIPITTLSISALIAT